MKKLIDQKEAHSYHYINHHKNIKETRMRVKTDPQAYFSWLPESRSKIVQEYEKKYNTISQILNENNEILDLIDDDLKKISSDTEKGRKADFTTENLLRAIIVHHLEDQSLRGTEVLLSHNIFLQDFIRLGDRKAPSYGLLCQTLKAISPQTWEKINKIFIRYAVEKNYINPSTLRVDTTVVESNIHYPTDVSLLWDSYRLIIQLINRARNLSPGVCPYRFHKNKVKKLYIHITRYAPSKSKKRQRKVKENQVKLIEQVVRITEVAYEFINQFQNGSDKTLQYISAQLNLHLGNIETIISVAKRVWIYGEKVPAKDRIFSLFEDHAELIKRGRRNKPVEFGHKILLGQTKEKIITQYSVLRKNVVDSKLPERILKEHKATFGKLPDELAADKGFCGDKEAMNNLREKVKVLAIPQKLKDFNDNLFVTLQHFRAGIEGSISALKRAFGLLRCQYRGFKSFASHVGLGVFSYNLVALSKLQV
jgi:transposase, IS5 family